MGIPERLYSKWDTEENGCAAGEAAGGLDKYWWVCDRGGHSFLADMYKAERNACGVCHGRQVVPGVNDFASAAPAWLLGEWDMERNGRTPQEYSRGSSAQVWWKCAAGHSFRMEIQRRMKRGDRCPSCSGKTLVPGVNDLLTHCRNESGLVHLISEWDKDRNGPMSRYTKRSGRKAWWRCASGHEWQAYVSNRTAGDGCRRCGRSQGEKELAGWAQDIAARHDIPMITGDRVVLGGLELDIFFPGVSRAIEYNGEYWHQDRVREERKLAACADAGISLAIVWEKDWKGRRGDIERALISFITQGILSPVLVKLEGT